MAGIYTRANIYTDIQRDAGNVTNIDRLVNRAARFVVTDLDLRSTKRRAYLSPSLNQDQYNYQAPADLKEWALVDIRRVADRLEREKFNVVTTEYFDRNKTGHKRLVCIEDRDWLKMLRVSGNVEGDDLEAVVNEANSLTDNGTWSVSLDASNLTLDSVMFIQGDASLNFDMDIGGTTTTAGYIQNSTMDAVDLSDYELGGSIFAWVYIPVSDSDLDGFTLRIGSDASNYFSGQVTVTNENLAFYIGWNLLRFDFNSMTETGTVDMENIDYVRLAVDRGALGTLNSTDWRLDYIIARRGIPQEVWYYTKYAWQNSSGTYLENSSASTDTLNADTEEYELFILKGKELVASDLKMFDDAKEYSDLYEAKKVNYLTKYPSERLLVRQTYHNFLNNPQEDWLNPNY